MDKCKTSIFCNSFLESYNGSAHLMPLQKLLNVEKVKGSIPAVTSTSYLSLSLWLFMRCLMPYLLFGCVQWDAWWLPCTLSHSNYNDTPCVWPTLEIHKVSYMIFHCVICSVKWRSSSYLARLKNAFLDAALKSWLFFPLMFSPFGTLSLLSALTCEVVKVYMANFTEEETWSWVARDILLDTWTALLMVGLLIY